MNYSIPKRRNLSTIQQVNSFNNWFNVQQQKSSTISHNQTKLTSQSYYSTQLSNPQSSDIKDDKQQPIMRRTYSAFKNSQSRVTGLKDKVFDLSHDQKIMAEKTKKTKLALQIMTNQLSNELKQRNEELKHSIQNLHKLTKSIIKVDEIRTEQIKKDTSQLASNYNQLKQQLLQIHYRISAIEHQCGFMTFASKLAY